MINERKGFGGRPTCWLHGILVSGHGTGQADPFPLFEARQMNADAIHTALGLAFTAIWLLVGQIIVGSR
jgi:hypothetical protein